MVSCTFGKDDSGHGVKGRVQESQSGRKQEGQLGGSGGAQVKSPRSLELGEGQP